MSEYKKAYSITAAELVERGRDDVPKELVSSTHLIYSSPATLAFNSPGAQGYGVKRAGLSIPGSVMLLVSPGCCGRNTTILTEYEEYRDRFFFLTMDETDIVTGRHLRKIPKAVKEVYDCLEHKPSVVMICITCVDALLGTDMERVCKKASDEVGIPVLPCYMYALTREGRKPPMVHVRQSLYSLLKMEKKRGDMVNLLGHFAPLVDDCELYPLLRSLGVNKINEISRCRDFDEYMDMGNANFNLVLHPEARYAAADLQKRLGMPSIELARVYQIDKIRKQYQLFATAVGASLDDSLYYDQTKEVIDQFVMRHPNLSFSVGEGCNANAFELSLALLQYGFSVPEIFANVTTVDFVYLRKIAELSPDTKIYTNLEPTMIYYDPDEIRTDITIGKDAGYYHPDAVHVEWSSDIQPFGYAGLTHFFEECESALRKKQEHISKEDKVNLTAKQDIENSIEHASKQDSENSTEHTDKSENIKMEQSVKGLWKSLSPFAPDQSGATAVLCEMGGLIVIIDAGGCAGNICGFDEPRWFGKKSAIFSAGLRDMDAILGRDDRLIAKVQKACEDIDGKFVALVGTPVPSVIGTDYKALKRMLEMKTQLPALNLDTNGVNYYDAGCEKAWLALFETFTEKSFGMEPGTYGIIGATPFDVPLDGFCFDSKRTINCYGMGAGIEQVCKAGSNMKNYVVAPSGLKAARYLSRRFGVPFEVNYPLEQIEGHDAFLTFMKRWNENMEGGVGKSKKILIVHQQILAHTLRLELEQFVDAQVIIASWFMMDKELLRRGDIRLHEEMDWLRLVQEGNFDVVIADELMGQAFTAYDGIFIALNHFPVSGKPLAFADIDRIEKISDGNCNYPGHSTEEQISGEK